MRVFLGGGDLDAPDLLPRFVQGFMNWVDPRVVGRDRVRVVHGQSHLLSERLVVIHLHKYVVDDPVKDESRESTIALLASLIKSFVSLKVWG